MSSVQQVITDATSTSAGSTIPKIASTSASPDTFSGSFSYMTTSSFIDYCVSGSSQVSIDTPVGNLYAAGVCDSTAYSFIGMSPSSYSFIYRARKTEDLSMPSKQTPWNSPEEVRLYFSIKRKVLKGLEEVHDED